jgi:perosamine synthetase
MSAHKENGERIKIGAARRSAGTQRTLPYGRQAINQDDLEAVVRVLQGDWLTQGPTIGDFEEAFAAVHGAKHAVAFANGTAALHGACFAAGLGPGDEALVPAMTFAATANAVVYVGGEPVFVDVDPATGLLDPEQLTRAITGRTRAILPMHYAGLPVDMDAIRTVARAHGLKIIADACHAAGAVYRGEKAGVLGDLACFSFHPVKHLTTGEGGMVLTDDPDEAARLRLSAATALSPAAGRPGGRRLAYTRCANWVTTTD